jgi:hypothetical protein
MPDIEINSHKTIKTFLFIRTCRRMDVVHEHDIECTPLCSQSNGDYDNPIEGIPTRSCSLFNPVTISGSPTTFGRSMRLHLDDVRFDDPCSTRPGFCAAESISRQSIDENFLAHTSSKISAPHDGQQHGVRHGTHAHETSTHISSQEPPDVMSRSLSRKNDEGAPQLDSFLRQPASILIGVGGRHRSVSPMRKVSVTLSNSEDRPQSPVRHRSLSPMSRWTASAADADPLSASAPRPSVSEAPVMVREHKVYTAQVATALTTGKPVWL